MRERGREGDERGDERENGRERAYIFCKRDAMFDVLCDPRALVTYVWSRHANKAF